MSVTRTVELSTKSIIAALVIFGGAWCLWALREVLLLLGICVVIAAALHPMINRLQRWGVPRPAGILALYALILGAVTIVVITFAPIIVEQLRQLAIALIHISNRFAGGTSAEATVSAAIGNMINGLIKAVSTNAWHVVGVITIGGQWLLFGAILVYELVVDRGSFRGTVSRLIPARYRRAFLLEGDRVERRLGLWLRGITTVGLVIAILAGVGLAILGIPYAFVLALIAGVSEFVPLVGPYIAMIPAAAIGFSMSPVTGAIVVLLYYGIQQLENNFIAPKVVSKAVGLRPVVVFLAILVGARLAGVFGIIFAVPGVILVESLYAVIQVSRQSLPRHA